MKVIIPIKSPLIDGGQPVIDVPHHLYQRLRILGTYHRITGGVLAVMRRFVAIYQDRNIENLTQFIQEEERRRGRQTA